MKRFMVFVLLTLAGQSFGDEVHLWLKDGDVKKAKEVKELKKHVDSGEVEVKSFESSKNPYRMPSAGEVDAILKDLGADISKLDRLNRDLFFRSLQEWPRERVVKKFEVLVPREDIEKAWDKVHGESK